MVGSIAFSHLQILHDDMEYGIAGFKFFSRYNGIEINHYVYRLYALVKDKDIYS